MSNEHTPGPWSVSSIGAGFEIEDANGKPIAQTQQLAPVRRPEDHDERRANARLISASPDLLEALQLCALVCAGEALHKQGLINALEKARAAMAKAKGLAQ